MTKQEILEIPALHCSSCGDMVKRVLKHVPSVEVTRIDTEAKKISIRFDESETSLNHIREALEEVGFYAED